MKNTKKATIIGLLVNVFLFVIKGFAGLITGSTAIISDAVNSLMDLVASIGTYIAIKIGRKRPDEGHPFGHRRAEPIAALLIAIFAAVLAFEIFKNAIRVLINGESSYIVLSPLAVIILVAAILIKIVIARYFYKVGTKEESPALLASSTDFQNDILCTTIALIGFVGGSYNILYIDDIAAIIIAGFIFYSGCKIGLENLDYLMGKNPDEATLFEIKTTALSVDGVVNIHNVKAHYVGNYIHVELYVDVNKNLLTIESHKIAEKVKKLIEDIHHIDKAFVHIEPV